MTIAVGAGASPQTDAPAPLPSNLERPTFVTPYGRVYEILVRPNTSDWNMCNAASAAHNEYSIPFYQSGVMLDIGACMGSVTIPLMLDNPDSAMVAVEPLPENVALLRANLELNGLTDRCTVIEGAANGKRGKVRIGYGDVADPSNHHEFIGNEHAPEGSREVRVNSYSLRALAGGDIRFVKIDCEGCEYDFFADPGVKRIVEISGEVHFGWDRLVKLLSPTHDVTGEGKDFGYFHAVRRG